MIDEEDLKNMIARTVAMYPNTTEEDVQKIVAWCNQAMVDSLLLELVLEGEVIASWSEKENDVVFVRKEEH